MPVLDNQRHERFAQEIAKGAPAGRAYEAAGYEGAGADQNGSRLMKNDKVAARIQEIKEAAATKVGVTVERVMGELAKIGFSDIRQAVAWRANATQISEDPETGEPKIVAHNEVVLIDSDKIDDATAGAISEISQTAQGGIKIKFHDKRAALVDLGKHLGMFKEKVEVTGKDGGPIETHDVSGRELARRIALALSRNQGAEPASG